MENQYNLLRPVTIEDIRDGKKLQWRHTTDVTVASMVNEKGTKVSLLWNDDTIYVYDFPEVLDRIGLAPIGWVENKPVYPEDVLYYNQNSSYPGSKFIAKDAMKNNEHGILGHAFFTNGEVYDSDTDWDYVSYLTWGKPKKKVEGWINVYRNRKASIAYKSKETADKFAKPDRVAVVHTTWEE